jgi:hypothetical protein
MNGVDEDPPTAMVPASTFRCWRTIASCAPTLVTIGLALQTRSGAMGLMGGTA